MKVLDRIIFYNNPEKEVTGNIVHQLEKFAALDPKDIFKYIKNKKNWGGYELSVANKALDMIVTGEAKFVWREVAEPEPVVEEIDEEEKTFLKKLETAKQKSVKKQSLEIKPEPEEGLVEPGLIEEEILEEEAAKELAKIEKEAAAKPYEPNELVKSVKEEVKRKAGRPSKKK